MPRKYSTHENSFYVTSSFSKLEIARFLKNYFHEIEVSLTEFLVLLQRPIEFPRRYVMSNEELSLELLLNGIVHALEVLLLSIFRGSRVMIFHFNGNDIWLCYFTAAIMVAHGGPSPYKPL